jgi:hypothetical protein
MMIRQKNKFFDDRKKKLSNHRNSKLQFGIWHKNYSSAPNRRACTVLFWSARLLILRKFSPLHVYFFLHSSLILACTFINFEKKFPPARSYLGLHVYWFWNNFPTCTFISYCTSIRYTRVLLLSFVSMQFWTEISNQSGSQKIHAWILLKK